MKKIIAVFFLFFCISIFSQDNSENTIKVGILEVTANNNYKNAYKNALQASVTKVFAEKKRFTVVDRTKLGEVAKEKNLQKQEDFINSSFLAEQGKSVGAQYLISANINNIVYSNVNIEKTNWLTNQKSTILGLQISITLNVNVIDVSTGTVKSGKVFQNDKQYESTNVDASVTSSITAFEFDFKAWINDVFPVEMKIIRIDSKDKHGKAETILIEGGSDMNLSVNKNLLFNNSSELDVYYNDVLKIDGKDRIRKVVIGKVKVSENQGDFSIAKIKKGAEEIQKELDEGKALYLSVNKY